MKKTIRACLPLMLGMALLILTGCVAGDPTRWNELHPAGFWAGLWHGMIAVVTFIISLFSDKVRMYECANNGGWYDFGFLLGVLIIWGGGAGASARASRRKKEKPRD